MSEKQRAEADYKLPELTGARRYGREATKLVKSNRVNFMHIEQVVKEKLERESQLAFAQCVIREQQEEITRLSTKRAQEIADNARMKTVNEDALQGLFAMHDLSIVDAMQNTEYAKRMVRFHLANMTDDQKRSLYRSVVTKYLATAAPASKDKGDTDGRTK